MPLSPPRLTAVQPLWAVEGGRVTLYGSDFPTDGASVPDVRIGEIPARVVFASTRAIAALVPQGLAGGRTAVRLDAVPGETAFIEVGPALATGLHQVDNPVFDAAGNLYVTYSGARGERVPVSIFRVGRDGRSEPFVEGIVNATSTAFDAAGDLYVSSRFEGTVYRVHPDGRAEIAATDLGIACGLAFGPDGDLFVGDRSGTIFRLTPSGRTTAFASLPQSVAAFHLAMGPDACLHVTGPTLASYDHVYRIDDSGRVEIVYAGFGRPQGIAFDAQGSLYVVEALAGSSGLYRVRPEGVGQVLAGPGLVGVAIDPFGGLIVVSNETAYRLDVSLRPLP